MSMTKREKMFHEWIYDHLNEEGYPKYATLFNYFDLRLTKRDVIGYMVPAEGYIVLNENLEQDQVSVVVRHEILHFFLNHEKRLISKLAASHGLDPDKLDDLTLNGLKKELYNSKFVDPKTGNLLPRFNYAADYEISNKAYTDEDKETIRKIVLNGQVVSGLVTEDGHPDWVDLSVEDMYDKLLKHGRRRVTGKILSPTSFMNNNGQKIGK